MSACAHHVCLRSEFDSITSSPQQWPRRSTCHVERCKSEVSRSTLPWGRARVSRDVNYSKVSLSTLPPYSASPRCTRYSLPDGTSCHASHRVRARDLDLGARALDLGDLGARALDLGARALDLVCISGVSRRTSHGAYSEVSRVRARSTRSNGEACWPMNEMPRRNVSLQRRATSDCGARGDTWKVRRRGRDRYDLVSRHAIRILTVWQ